MYFEFLQCKHVLQYDDLVPFRAGVFEGRDVVVAPVSELAARRCISSTLFCHLWGGGQELYILVQLLSLPDHLFLIPLARLCRRLLLALVGKVGRLHLHALGIPKPEARVIQQLDGQLYRLGSKVHDQRVPFELSFFILIHLDPRLATVDLLGYDAAFGEDGADFFEGGVWG